MDMVTDRGALGERVRSLRERRGLSQTELAEQAGMDRTALSKVEAGSRGLSALELARIAEALSLTIPDVVYLPPEQVRAAREPMERVRDGASPSEEARFEAEVRLDRLLRDAEQLRSLGVLPVPQHRLEACSITSVDDAAALAGEVRRLLEVGRAPLGAMSEVCAAFGLWVCAVDVEVDGLSATPEPGFGVAVVGAGETPGRRRATAAHELGHHLIGDRYTGHVSLAQAMQGEDERLIDSFAAALLLPTEVCRERMRDVAPERRRDELIRLCCEHRVSWTLGLRRCRESGAEVPASDQAAPTARDFLLVVGAGPEPDLHEGVMARGWVSAALRAAEAGLVTPVRAQELARTDVDLT